MNSLFVTIDEMNLIAGSQPGEASVCAQALLVCTWRTIKEVKKKNKEKLIDFA